MFLPHIWVFIAASWIVASFVGSRRPSKREGKVGGIPNPSTHLSLYIKSVPIVSPSSIPVLGLWIGAFRYALDSVSVLREGYQKHRNQTFRVPEMTRWTYIVSGPELLEDLRRAPDDVLSFADATAEIFAIPWILGQRMHQALYEIPTVLIRRLAHLVPQVQENTSAAFQKHLTSANHEWIPVDCLSTMTRIAGYLTTVAFAGEDVANNSEYVDRAIGFTFFIAVGAKIVTMFPDCLRGVAGAIVAKLSKQEEMKTRFLEPMIKKRIEELNFSSLNEERNFLTWYLLDKKRRGVFDEEILAELPSSLLALNFASVSTVPLALTHCVYHLAASSSYQNLLRSEIDGSPLEETTEESLKGLRKLDSFIKETMRYNGVGAVSLTRKVLKPIVLSDGTVLHKGNMVSCIAEAMHRDNKVWAAANTFDALRFFREKEEKEEEREDLTTLSPSYQPFGLGRHACPGRFFASVLIKIVLIHLLKTYDFRFEHGDSRPEDEWIGLGIVPNRKAKILFRKRI
ncbi:cytochrome P450 [Atractiella rhizophila]|nr:cytochrome P450 [Atractiella rhizophila]